MFIFFIKGKEYTLIYSSNCNRSTKVCTSKQWPLYEKVLIMFYEMMQDSGETFSTKLKVKKKKKKLEKKNNTH